MEPETKSVVPDEKSRERDALCAPLARTAIKLCLDKRPPLDDVPEAISIKDVTESIIEEMSKSDLTTRDVKFVSKLMVQAIANGLVSTFETDGIESGNERYMNAAFDVLQILVDEEVSLGIIPPEELKDLYAGVGPRIVGKLQELGLNAVEVDHVFSLLTRMMENVGNNVVESVETAKERAAEKLFGVEDLDYVKISRIVEIQKS